MTLIVAKKNSKGKVIIASDTKLNYCLSKKLPKYSNQLQNGFLKTFIINNGKIAVSYAGDFDTAKKTFTLIANLKDINSIIEILKASSLDSSRVDNETEYLLCCAESNTIYKIFRGFLSELDDAWIGDSSAITYFRTEYSKLEKSDSSVSSNIKKALQSTIDNQFIETVGGFCILTYSNNNLFYYSNSHTHKSGLKKVKIGSTPTFIPILTTLSTPSYSESIIGNNNGVLIYIHEIDFGILYKVNPFMFSPVINKLENFEFSSEITNLKLNPFLKIGTEYSYKNSLYSKLNKFNFYKDYTSIILICDSLLSLENDPGIFFQRALANHMLFLEEPVHNSLRFINAISDYEKVIELTGIKSKESYYNLSLLFYEMGKISLNDWEYFFNNALYFASNSNSNNSDYNSYQLIGDIYKELWEKDFSKVVFFKNSLHYYNKSLTLNINLENSFFNMGILCFFYSNFKDNQKEKIAFLNKSLEYYYFCLKINPNFLKARQNILAVKFELGKYVPFNIQNQIFSNLLNECNELLNIDPSIKETSYLKKELENIILKHKKNY